MRSWAVGPIVGKNCHIGAGAVLAGVIEPASAVPVVVEDNVLIGANAVVIEGVRVGEGAVVAAGAVVIEDVPPHTVVAGTPARVIKKKDEQAGTEDGTGGSATCDLTFSDTQKDRCTEKADRSTRDPPGTKGPLF